MESSSIARTSFLDLIESACEGLIKNDEILSRLLLDELDFHAEDEMDSQREAAAGVYLYDLVDETPAIELVEIILAAGGPKEPLSTKDIPQFSSIGDADKAMQILMNVGNPEITYREIGYFLDGADKTDGANQKYGEGHLKLAQALGFVSFDGRKQFVNAFGKTYLLFSASDSVRSEAVKAKMVLRVPFIQHMIALSAEKPGVRVIDELHKLCSDATARRRRSNIETLVNLLYEQYDKEVNSLLRRVDWESLR